jgi:hypothetical protein
MSALAQVLGVEPDPHPLRDAFLRWQCRVRQIAMRDNQGRPDSAIMADVTLAGQSQPMGALITLISKLPQYSKTPEMQYMVKKTFDPAQRREKALELFSETYYQKAREFSDILTATFQSGSQGAEKIRAADTCALHFEAYNQSFDIQCKVWKLTKKNSFYQSTWWHNHLFNPDMSLDTVILGFEPDWSASTADPMPK